MLGEAAPGAAERYVLCEINVSSVSPFPPSANAHGAQADKTASRWPSSPDLRRARGAGLRIPPCAFFSPS
jgi:hypothetical protein